MTTAWQKLRKLEFEGRMFIALGLASAVLWLCYTWFQATPSLLEIGGRSVGQGADRVHRVGYPMVALLFGCCSLLRMWAGSLLTAPRVMSFAIRTDLFSRRGPYRLMRHPIYAADLSALTLIACCLPWPALVMPLAFAAHYASITRYEEALLRARHGAPYDAFLAEVPRLLPTLRSLRQWPWARREFHLTREGIRHNALWALLVPGMLVASRTGRFSDALFLGAPAVLDWALVHTRLGVRHDGRISRTTSIDIDAGGTT